MFYKNSALKYFKYLKYLKIIFKIISIITKSLRFGLSSRLGLALLGCGQLAQWFATRLSINGLGLGRDTIAFALVKGDFDSKV